MNKIFTFLVAGAATCMLFAGCQPVAGPSADQAPEDVLQEGITKLSDVTSYTFDVGVNGALKGPEGETPEDVIFDMAMGGGIDVTDPQDPRLNFTLEGNFQADADGANGKFEFRMNNEALYANLIELTGTGAISIPDEMRDQFINQWWTLPVPPEALEELASTLPQGDANLTEEQKAVKELVENTKFFTDVEFVGTQDVLGEKSSHYKGSLDKDAFVTFIEKAAELQGAAVSAAEVADIKAGLEMIEFTGEMYVGNKSGILNRIKGSLVIKGDGSGDTPTGTIEFDMAAGDFNEPVEIVAPDGAMPVPLDLLGAGAGLPL